MGKKMTLADEELYKRVDEVLHYIWDPIGVSGAPMARDEYYSYLPQVFSLLKTVADAEKLATYLFKVTIERMGLTGNRTRDLEVAEILLNWKATIQEKYS